MSELAVIRHSLAKANEDGILMGAKLNSPLSNNGIGLAQQKGESLKARGFRPNKVITSNLDRAEQTAAIILEVLGLSLEIIKMPELNERDFGIHDGKPYASVIEAFDKIKTEMTGTTLVVTHSNPVLVMQAAVFDPEKINKFWQLGDPHHCDGFTLEV